MGLSPWASLGFSLGALLVGLGLGAWIFGVPMEYELIVAKFDFDVPDGNASMVVQHTAFWRRKPWFVCYERVDGAWYRKKDGKLKRVRRLRATINLGRLFLMYLATIGVQDLQADLKSVLGQDASSSSDPSPGLNS